ncbi:hypothetical protein ASZ90_005064 [hydrocarbon metagenome]|uniref:Secretion system C-terminal sorting domain-containing protein n=1 Tax=hydrocarbon metagenome TaxID=938273 RepID=A0A0W8FW64_9ZZZZ
MKKIIFLLLLFYSTGFGQIDNLTKISIEQKSATDFERSHIFEVSDTLFYFYRMPSSQVISIDFSIDNGATWTLLQKTGSLGLISSGELSIDIVHVDQGNFIIGYSTFPNTLKLLSYNLYTNTFEQTGNTHAVGGSQLELLRIDESSFIASIKNSQDDVYYFISADMGETWSDKMYFPEIEKQTNPLSLTYFNETIYSVFIDQNENSIYLFLSEDNGETWYSPVEIYSSTEKIQTASIYSDNSKIYVVFEQLHPVNFSEYFQSDIHYILSEDQGITWSESFRYTKFIGNDNISNLIYLNGKLFVLSLSNRSQFDIYDTYLGLLTTTEDPAPPLVYWISSPSSVKFGKEYSIRVFAVDDSEVTKVELELDGKVYQLYDDGNHGDSLAGDNIYGAFLESFEPTEPLPSVGVDINKIFFPIKNDGTIANLPSSVIKKLKLIVEDDNANQSAIDFNISFSPSYNNSNYALYDNKVIIFSSGFWLSGYAGSNLWANAVASSSLIEDYLPGNVGSTADDPDNLVYSVRASDTPFGTEWQNWRKAVEQGAYFYDGDGDGIYDPVDKNSNGVWDPNEDKPDILYNASFFTVYNDGRPAGQRRWSTVNPLGIEIRQTVFASNQNTILDDVIFIRYSILYKGLNNPSEPDSLTDVIFSIWADVDNGDHSDDKFGSDTLLNAGFIYNKGTDDLFGSNPPAIYKVITQGPLVKTDNPDDVGYNRMGPALGEISYQGYKNSGLTAFTGHIGGDSYLRDPSNTREARNYMKGLMIDGNEMNPCTSPYGEVHGNVNCETVNPLFWFSGDPVTNTGWIFKFAEDVRTEASTGEFTLVKNEPMDIIVAYVVGRGIDHLNSIDRAREITRYVHEEYERNFSTLVNVEDKQEELPTQFHLSQNYPNPFNPATKIKYTIGVVDENFRPLQTQLIVYDILGRKVKTLVNEVKAPGTYEITLDASQLASGVYLYRLSAGNFIQTKKMIILK